MNVDSARFRAQEKQRRVSVVIPHYNASRTLKRAIDSVAAQSEPALEVIVVDDGSRRDERDAVRNLLACFPFARFVELPKNCGAGTARNRGWDEANGEWVAFLDSDDAWHPRKLEVQLDTVASVPKDLQLIASKTIVVSGGSDVCWDDIPMSVGFSPLEIKHLLVRNRMTTPSVMVRRSLGARFSEGRRFSEDYELWLSIVGAGHQALLVEFPLTAIFKASFGVSGLSSHTWRMIWGEYLAFCGAYKSGSLSIAQTSVGIAISTCRSVVRLVRIGLKRLGG